MSDLILTGIVKVDGHTDFIGLEEYLLREVILLFERVDQENHRYAFEVDSFRFRVVYDNGVYSVQLHCYYERGPSSTSGLHYAWLGSKWEDGFQYVAQHARDHIIRAVSST
jgi:hypothetical protein